MTNRGGGLSYEKQICVHWGALFLIAIVSIICYSRRQFSDNEYRIIRPCRFSINAVIEAVNGNLFDVVITSEDSEIKKGTNLIVRVPNNFKNSSQY